MDEVFPEIRVTDRTTGNGVLLTPVTYDDLDGRVPLTASAVEFLPTEQVTDIATPEGLLETMAHGGGEAWHIHRQDGPEPHWWPIGLVSIAGLAESDEHLPSLWVSLYDPSRETGTGGRGHATQAALGAMSFVFDFYDRRAYALETLVAQANLPSRRLVARLGFVAIDQLQPEQTVMPAGPNGRPEQWTVQHAFHPGVAHPDEGYGDQVMFSQAMFRATKRQHSIGYRL